MRASQIAQTYIDGNRSTARNAVLAEPRPDLMALDVLTDLFDKMPHVDLVMPEEKQYVLDRWRRCLAGGI